MAVGSTYQCNTVNCKLKIVLMLEESENCSTLRVGTVFISSRQRVNGSSTSKMVDAGWWRTRIGIEPSPASPRWRWLPFSTPLNATSEVVATCSVTHPVAPSIPRPWRVVCSGSDQEHHRAGPKNFGQFRCHFLADGPPAMLKV